MSGGLQPGDRVIDLVAVGRSAALVAGLVSALLASKLSGWTWGIVIAAGIAGAIVGFALGGFIGHVIFPAPPGEVTISRVGRESLGLALRASLAAGVAVTLLIAAIAFFTANAKGAGITFSVGVIVSIGMGCASALL